MMLLRHKIEWFFKKLFNSTNWIEIENNQNGYNAYVLHREA
jgi:hypothetical protein